MYAFAACRSAVVVGQHLSYIPSLVPMWLQEQIAAQASTIDELRESLASQLEDLESTQLQLEATQSSLIDLESHLTSLEEESDEDEPERLSSQAASDAPQATQRQAKQGSKDAETPNPVVSLDAQQHTSPEENDMLASAVVNAFDDLFPASTNSEEDDASGRSEAPEDPFELFERGKAAVEARGQQGTTGTGALSSRPNGLTGPSSVSPPGAAPAYVTTAMSPWHLCQWLAPLLARMALPAAVQSTVLLSLTWHVTSCRALRIGLKVEYPGGAPVHRVSSAIPFW